MLARSSDSHTFVVCAYGESSFLRDCVQSLKGQSVATRVLLYTSTPNGLINDVAAEFDVPVCVGEGEPGIANDWNRALSYVKTPLATIAHQDDVYLPRYAEVMLDMLGRAKKPIIFFSNYAEIREGEVVSDTPLLKVKRLMLSPIKDGRFGASRFIRRRILSLGTPICCPSVTFNLEALPDRQSLFDDSMKCSLDWWAWERLSRLEGSFCYNSEILMWHRIHSGSETTALIADQTRTREDYEMLKKFWPAPIAAIINGFYSESQKSNA